LAPRFIAFCAVCLATDRKISDVCRHLADKVDRGTNVSQWVLSEILNGGTEENIKKI